MIETSAHEEEVPEPTAWPDEENFVIVEEDGELTPPRKPDLRRRKPRHTPIYKYDEPVTPGSTGY